MVEDLFGEEDEVVRKSDDEMLIELRHAIEPIISGYSRELSDIAFDPGNIPEILSYSTRLLFPHSSVALPAYKLILPLIYMSPI